MVKTVIVKLGNFADGSNFNKNELLIHCRFSMIKICYSTTRFCSYSQTAQNGTSGVNGNSNCGCPKGFRKSGYRGECVDINECLDSPCDSNLNCINTPGGYQCVCANGQIYDPQHGALQGCNGRPSSSQVRYKSAIRFSCP